MERARLRAALRERRELLPAAVRASVSQAITAAVRQHPAWRHARALAGFVGVRGEPDTRGLLEAALGEGKQLWLPRVVSADRLEWIDVDDLEMLRPGKFGLLEPPAEARRKVEAITDELDLDLVLVPGLAFASSGARIGFGCGYYDRALASVRHASKPVRMGVCFSTFLDPPEGPIPMAAHDVPMHVLATERGVVSCGCG